MTATSTFAAPPCRQAIWFSLLLGVLLVPPLRAQATCLRFEPDTVQVQGTLVQRADPEPPGFVSVARGESERKQFYIQTAKPLCTATTGPGKAGQALTGIALVQLDLDSVAEVRLGPSLGQVVELKGLLSRGQAGRHHAPVVLWVRYTARTPAQRRTP